MQIRTQNLRDGTSQHQRSQPAQDPAYVAVDERTLADHLRFARNYAKTLTYFNAQNQPQGDWSPFFNLDDATIQELAQVIESFDPQNPDTLESLQTISAESSQLAAQPHLALFLTFLHLLKYPQQQFRDLTQRRLDFYYRQVLQLSEKAAQPDQVNVIFSLAPGQTEVAIPQGTRLNAGKDSQGLDLHYATDQELYLNQAQVASVKTISLEKDYIDLATIHRAGDRSNEAFEDMLRLAVGTPNQGDPLPLPLGEDAPAQGEDTLNAIMELFSAIEGFSLEQVTAPRQQYILNQLCFVTLEDFQFCFSTHARELTRYAENSDTTPPTESEWQRVYALVKKAYRKKINRDRRSHLKQEHRRQYDRQNPQKGFMALWQFALGPQPPWPSHLKAEDDNFNFFNLLITLDSDRSGPTDSYFEATSRYIQEHFFLTTRDFRQIMSVRREPEAADQQEAVEADWPWTNLEHPAWEEVYRLLEKAQTKQQGFTYPPLGRTTLKAVQARGIGDAESDQPLTLERFHPFIAPPQTAQANESETNVQPLGIAITSPLLHLQEGTREITLSLACLPGSFSRNRLEEILRQQQMPFELHISSAEEWLSIADDQFSLTLEQGDELRPTVKQQKSYASSNLTLSNTQQTASLTAAAARGEDGFSPDDVGTLLVWPEGNVYRIAEVTNNRRVVVNLVKNVGPIPEANDTIQQYPAVGLADVLRFTITLDATQPAIAPATPSDTELAFTTDHPVIELTLKQQAADNENAYYQEFKDLALEKIALQVSVTGLTNLQLRNDRSTVNPKSPFEPFEAQPKVGSSFYFVHPELVSKPLTQLELTLMWVGLPDNFATHYHAYSRCGLDPSPVVITNESFKGQLALFRDRTWHSTTSENQLSLFNPGNDNLPPNSTLTYNGNSLAQLSTGFAPLPDPDAVDDLLEQDSYFRLELAGSDFQHDLYALVLNKVARATDTTIKDLTVFPPYTPKVKSFSIGYKAAADIALESDVTDPIAGQVFQLHPFGYLNLRQTVKPEDKNKRYHFLPQYDADGSLFIGLRQVHPPQQLTLLFQIISGSGNADLPNPTVHWSYLTGNHWQPFKEDEVLSDSTNGLLDSGIIRLTLPPVDTQTTTVMPRGLYWLRATVNSDAPAIPDMLDIRTQAVTATFVDQGNAPDHLRQPLAAQSIQSLVERLPAVSSLQQPYSSFGGRQREPHRAFYTRVGERLRHRQRALTRWDYERLVLEKFPQIYKAKCLTQAEQAHAPGAAQVTVVVIPNLANTKPFLPLEPKAPQYLLQEIESYLQAHTSPFVKVVVKNPRYQRIKYRVAVRFRSGYDQGYHLKQLNDALVRFLSPWAYEEQSTITFGSSIHSSKVIHFIDSQPYVDYVANLKLIEETENIEPDRSSLNTTYAENTTGLAQGKQADSILVSALSHIIDLISNADYTEEDFEGIDYMIIGVDFVVG